METGHPLTRAVNSGSGNRALVNEWMAVLSDALRNHDEKAWRCSPIGSDLFVQTQRKMINKHSSASKTARLTTATALTAAVMPKLHLPDLSTDVGCYNN